MHLLDSDTLTHLYEGHPRVRKHLHDSTDPNVGTTIVSKIEMLRGRLDFVLKASEERLLRAQELLNRTEEFLSGILVVPLDVGSVEAFSRLKSTRGFARIGRA